MSLVRSILLLAAALLATITHAGVGRGSWPIGPHRISLDHVNVAVRDLSAASGTYESLGFTPKPGRLHPNSIDNMHIKFRDGTEIELITASEPLDPLAEEYLELLQSRDGGAFLALRTPDLDAIRQVLEKQNYAVDMRKGFGSRYLTFDRGTLLRPLWLIEKNKPAAETDEYLDHPNTAESLAAVWFSPAIWDSLGGMLRRIGDELPESGLRTQEVRRVDLGGGSVLATTVPAAGAARAILGITVTVRSMKTAEDLLVSAGVEFQTGCDSSGTWVAVNPRAAHGIWLKFLQRDEEAVGDQPSGSE